MLAFSGVQAHHSRAMFDAETIRTLEGRISKATWRNPHVYFELDAESADGQITTWTLESGSVARLARSGWTQDTLTVGDRVTVGVHPHVEPTRAYAALVDVALADGTRISATSDAAPAATRTVLPSTDFSGTWTISRRRNADGTVGNEALSAPSGWPLTEKGRLAVQSFDVGDDPMFDCIFYGVPRLAASVYSRRWTREPGRIVIEQEQYPITRIVHLDGSAPPADFVRTPAGYSTGRFEPDGTLVVETVGFSYTRWGSAAGIDSSERKRVVETYRLSADGLQLHYAHTLTDPEFLTEPVTASFTYEKIADREFVYETCDPDSAKIPLKFSSGSE